MEMFKLGSHDAFKGAVTAVFTAIVVMLYGLVTQGDFNIFTADWGRIVNDMFNVGIAAFLGYISKNFLSDSEGNFLGKV